MTHDPIRLLDDPSAHAALRRDLTVAARHRAPYDAAAGAARFEASLAKGAGAASSGWSGAALGVGALILGGLISGGIWMSGAGEPSIEPPPARGSGVAGPVAAREPVAPSVAVAGPVVEGPVVAGLIDGAPPATPEPVAPVAGAVPEDMARETGETPPAAKPARAPRVKAPKKDLPGAAPAEVSSGGADYLREARSLQAARGLLGRDPAGALARAQAGAAEFPQGAFAQEWEGVAILALFELGRRSEVEDRASRFLARYPKGPYAAQVREALGRP